MMQENLQTFKYATEWFDSLQGDTADYLRKGKEAFDEMPWTIFYHLKQVDMEDAVKYINEKRVLGAAIWNELHLKVSIESIAAKLLKSKRYYTAKEHDDIEKKIEDNKFSYNMPLMNREEALGKVSEVFDNNESIKSETDSDGQKYVKDKYQVPTFIGAPGSGKTRLCDEIARGRELSFFISFGFYHDATSYIPCLDGSYGPDKHFAFRILYVYLLKKGLYMSFSQFVEKIIDEYDANSVTFTKVWKYIKNDIVDIDKSNPLIVLDEVNVVVEKGNYFLDLLDYIATAAVISEGIDCIIAGTKLTLISNDLFASKFKPVFIPLKPLLLGHSIEIFRKYIPTFDPSRHEKTLSIIRSCTGPPRYLESLLYVISDGGEYPESCDDIERNVETYLQKVKDDIMVRYGYKYNSYDVNILKYAWGGKRLYDKDEINKYQLMGFVCEVCTDTKGKECYRLNIPSIVLCMMTNTFDQNDLPSCLKALQNLHEPVTHISGLEFEFFFGIFNTIVMSNYEPYEEIGIKDYFKGAYSNEVDICRVLIPPHQFLKRARSFFLMPGLNILYEPCLICIQNNIFTYTNNEEERTPIPVQHSKLSRDERILLKEVMCSFNDVYWRKEFIPDLEEVKEDMELLFVFMSNWPIKVTDEFKKELPMNCLVYVEDNMGEYFSPVMTTLLTNAVDSRQKQPI